MIGKKVSREIHVSSQGEKMVKDSRLKMMVFGYDSTRITYKTRGIPLSYEQSYAVVSGGGQNASRGGSSEGLLCLLHWIPTTEVW